MKSEYREIMPGVRLRVVQTDRFKSSCFSVSFLQRLEAGNASKNAAIPRILRRGSRLHPDLESLAAELDALYGARVEPVVRKLGDVQAFGMLCDFVDGRYTGAGKGLLDQCLKLVGEILLDPVVENGGFSEEAVAGERENLKDDIRSEINDKATYAYRRVLHCLYDGAGFGLSELGDVESVDALDGAELYRHYRALLESAPMELFCCGDFAFEQVEAAVKKAFARLERARVVPVAPSALPMPEGEREIIEQMDMAQAVLMVGAGCGIRFDDPAFPAMRVLSMVLGGGSTSKLFVNVREKKSLCYYTSALYDRFQGAMFLYCGVDPEKVDAARGELLRQLKACVDGEIDDEELVNAKKLLINQFKTIKDSPYPLENYWLSEAVAGTEITPGQAARSLSEVTVSQVAEAARRCNLAITYLLTGKGENVHERKYIPGDQ